MLCLALAIGAPSAVSCGSDERERPKPVPTNPELERYSKPGTPAPDQADTIAAACAAMLQHEAEACGAGAAEPENSAGAAGAAGALGPDVEDCLATWRRNDARGCGAAYARFIQCRTDTVDCENGWHADCDLYEDAAFLCTTEFVQRTTCTPISIANLCQDSAYSFGCVSPRKPFPECERASDTGSVVYCCF